MRETLRELFFFWIYDKYFILFVSLLIFLDMKIIFIYNEKHLGGIAQLVRAFAWHARGHRFEPYYLHHKTPWHRLRPAQGVFYIPISRAVRTLVSAKLRRHRLSNRYASPIISTSPNLKRTPFVEIGFRFFLLPFSVSHSAV